MEQGFQALAPFLLELGNTIVKLHFSICMCTISIVQIHKE